MNQITDAVDELARRRTDYPCLTNLTCWVGFREEIVLCKSSVLSSPEFL
jgi:hypothetical protein